MKKYRKILEQLVLPVSMVSGSEEAQSWILDQLLQNTDITVDERMLSSELARLEAYDSHILQQEILDSGNYSLLLPENREKRSQKLRQEAERELKIDFLLHFIAQQEQIMVTAEERECDALRIAKENRISLEEVRQFMGPSFEMLQDDLLIKKTIHWISSYQP